MGIDWNWFFSSFCQSAAALIGIIGAFIISRLLGLSEKISLTISQFDNLIIESNKVIASISKRRFTWYTNSILRYGTDLKKEIQTGDFENLSREEVLKRIYASENRLYKNDEAVFRAFNKLYEDNKPRKAEPISSHGLTISKTSPLNFDIIPPGIWENINKEKDLIDQLEIEAKTIIQHFRQNLQDINSFVDTIKPLQIIIVLLMIAFPITVIYPLHFMPMPLNENPRIAFNLLTILKSFISLKSILLLAFFITIEGIFCYFLFLTNQLNNRLTSAKRNNSDDIRNIRTYSEYFKED